MTRIEVMDVEAGSTTPVPVAPPAVRGNGAEDRPRSPRPTLDGVLRPLPSPEAARALGKRLRRTLATHLDDPAELADALLLLLVAKGLDETDGFDLDLRPDRRSRQVHEPPYQRLCRLTDAARAWLVKVTKEPDWPDLDLPGAVAAECLDLLAGTSLFLTASSTHADAVLQALLRGLVPGGRLPNGSAFARPVPSTELLDAVAFKTRSSRTRSLAVAGCKAFGQLPRLKERNLEWMRGNYKKGELCLTNLPKLIHVELSTHCNLRCRFCSIIREERGRELGYISMETLERLRPALAFVTDCKLHGGGEPFMHPRIEDVLRVFLDEGVRLNTVTNATLIRPKLARLVGATFTSLTVSVDGADKATYEHLRERASWERLLRGIDLINEHRGPDLRLIVGVVMLKDNIAQLPDLVRFAADHGAQELQAAWLVPFEELPWTHDQSLTDDPVGTNRWMDEARAVGDELGISVRIPDNLPVPGEGPAAADPPAHHHPAERGADRAGDRPSTIVAIEHQASYRDLHGTDRVEGHCRLMYDRAMVRMEGDIKPCGQSMYVPGLGSLHEQSFEQCWNSEAYQRLRATFNGGTLPPTCKSCNFIRSKQLGSARLVYD